MCFGNIKNLYVLNTKLRKIHSENVGGIGSISVNRAIENSN